MLLREVCSSINANNALDQNPPTISEVCDTPFTTNHGNANSVPPNKLTLSPDEDLQCVVKCCNQLLSDYHETNNKQNSL